MQIVIPMSGFGERFRKAGYMVPKPLIEIDGKPVIAHVIDMFPGETDFLFICNQEHLAESTYRMRDILAHYCPTGRVVGIPPHKLGPVHAVACVYDLIDPARPVVANYCDFTCFWSWRDFKNFVAETGCDGAIPAYKGFHPHSLGTTNYAYLRESGGWVSDIREKQPWTDNRMDEYASSGTYYFRTGALMKNVFDAQMRRDITVGGEFYASLAYKLLFEQGARVAVYELQHFMQWGTPEDVAEYRMWSDIFRRLASPRETLSALGGTSLIPMAGAGARFVKEGYALPKPLIPVSGRPMVVQAVDDLPPVEQQIFVLRRDMPGVADISATLAATWPGCRLVMLDTITEGQANTALSALVDADALPDGPLTIAACDNGTLFSGDRLVALMGDLAVDVIVWVVRGYPNAARHPRMYGWVDADESGRIRGISVKQPLGRPTNDPIVTGTFTFRRAADFVRAANRMIGRGARVNGEFYIDTCVNDAIALGLECRIFEIDAYLCWGTPNDLRTFEYWQSCFHKWDGHPYRLDADARVPIAARSAIEARYRAILPPRPAR